MKFSKSADRHNKSYMTIPFSKKNIWFFRKSFSSWSYNQTLKDYACKQRTNTTITGTVHGRNLDHAPDMFLFIRNRCCFGWTGSAKTLWSNLSDSSTNRWTVRDVCARSTRMSNFKLSIDAAFVPLPFSGHPTTRGQSLVMGYIFSDWSFLWRPIFNFEPQAIPQKKYSSTSQPAPPNDSTHAQYFIVPIPSSSLPHQ